MSGRKDLFSGLNNVKKKCRELGKYILHWGSLHTFLELAIFLPNILWQLLYIDWYSPLPGQVPLQHPLVVASPSDGAILVAALLSFFLGSAVTGLGQQPQLGFISTSRGGVVGRVPASS